MRKVDLGEMVILSRQFKQALDAIKTEYGLDFVLVNNYVFPDERAEEYAIRDEHRNTRQRFMVVYEDLSESEDKHEYVARLKAFDEEDRIKSCESIIEDHWTYDMFLALTGKAHEEYMTTDWDRLYDFIQKYVLAIDEHSHNYEDHKEPEVKNLSDREMLKIGYRQLEYVDEEVWGPSKSFVEVTGEIGGDHKTIRVYRDGRSDER